MKKNMLIACLGIGLALSGPTGADQLPFGGPDSIAYSEKLWSVLQQEKLVDAPAKNPPPYRGVHPHGAILTTVHSETSVGGHTGKVIVKKNYEGDGVSIDEVAAAPQKYLQAVTVMFQREEGYDSENQNWFWAKYTPDGGLDSNEQGKKLAGRVARGKPAGCIACHVAAPGGDYIYTH